VKRVSNTKYTGMCLNWENETLWKKVYIPKSVQNGRRSDDSEDESQIQKSKCLISLNELV
jgi:hypothetical protein